MGQGISRNAYRTTKLAGALGLAVQQHKSWLDHAAQRKYPVACRRIFADCVSFAMTPDKTRISGRDYLGSSLFSPEVDRICWCAPQAW